MTDPESKLLDCVNRSGFPFQIAIEHFVKSSGRQHGWRVAKSEHAWRNPFEGTSGFLDLLLEDRYGTTLLNVECKRVTSSDWIFLVPSASPKKRYHAKSWVTFLSDDRGPRFFNWHDLVVGLDTYESSFCTVNGQDPKARPMLERVAAEVVSSTESYALQEITEASMRVDGLRMFFNVIVTTANLQVCKFDPETIAIEDGKIDTSEFEEVPFLRFRKQLRTYENDRLTPVSSERSERLLESTVFIVNASHLEQFLLDFEVTDSSAREIERYVR